MRPLQHIHSIDLLLLSLIYFCCLGPRTKDVRWLQTAVWRDSDAVDVQIGPRGVTICSVVLQRAAQSPHFTVSLKELIN